MAIGKKLVLLHRIVKASRARKKLRVVEANDLLVVRIVGRAMQNRLLQIAQRVVIRAGVKLTQSPQSHDWRNAGLELKETGESRRGVRILIGAVVEQAEIKPSLSPIRFLLHGLLIEIDCRWQIPGVACGSCTLREFVKRRGALRTEASRTDEEQRAKKEE